MDTYGKSGRAFENVVLSAALLIGITGVAMPVTSHAEDKCWNGPTVTDWRGRNFNTRTCPTWTGSYVNSEPWSVGEGALHVGYLYAGNNWVVCQMKGLSNNDHGPGLNDIWLYTQSDKTLAYPERQGWGWLPATAMSYGGDYQPIPGVPWCSEYPGYNPY
ncbi:MAG: hypothetical protein HY308_10600 [Gammaproteobacteria bacterium]|nr:hypothetical protein [Gammaproteobacteria bacterium]